MTTNDLYQALQDNLVDEIQDQIQYSQTVPITEREQGNLSEELVNIESAKDLHELLECIPSRITRFDLLYKVMTCLGVEDWDERDSRDLINTLNRLDS